MKETFIVDFFSSSRSLRIVLAAAGSSGFRLTLRVARLMAERSTLHRRDTSLPEIDKFCYYVVYATMGIADQ